MTGNINHWFDPTTARIHFSRATVFFFAGIWFGKAEETRGIERELNEYGAAKIVGDYKGRKGPS